MTSIADLSIIIVNYNTSLLLRQCVASIYADLSESNLVAELLVVDNDSTDDSVTALHQSYPTLRVITTGSNRGYGTAANLGLRAAGGRHLLLLNSDTLVQTGALRGITAFLDAQPDAGIAGPRLLNADGSVQRSAFRFPSLVQVALDLFPLFPRLTNTPLNGRYNEDVAGYEQPFRPDFILGAAMGIRRAAFEQAGGFDEGFFMYAEEVDWQQRIRAAGWQVYSLPAARLIHFAGQSTRQQPGRMFVELHRSRARYYRLHEPLAFRLTARLLTRTAMLWNALADWQKQIRGQFDEQELRQRWRVYGQVFRLKG